MLSIKWLEFEAIGRFVEKQRIDFTSLGNLAQIDGKNKNTGGSSGAAKSTILQALDFLFGVNNRPTTIMQSRLTKKTMSVSAGFDFDGKELVVSRGKKLTVELAGNVTTGSSKLSEEMLDQVIGMPRELFRKMYHKRQGERGFFLKMTPSQNYEFLIDCCGLSEMRKYDDILDSAIERVQPIKDQSDNALIRAKASLESYEKSYADRGEPPKQEIDQATVLFLKEKLDVASGLYSELQEKHRQERERIESKRPVLQNALFDRSLREGLEKELAALGTHQRDLEKRELERQQSVKASISELRLNVSYLKPIIASGNEARNEIGRVANEIKKIRDSICPTCEQGWVTESAKTKEQQLTDKLLVLKGMVSKGDESVKQLAETESSIISMTPLASPLHVPEVEELKTKQKEIQDSITKNRREEEDFNQAQHHLNRVAIEDFTKHTTTLSQMQAAESYHLSTNLQNARSEFDSAVNKFKSHDALVKSYELTQRTMLENVVQYKGKVHGIEIENAGLAAKLYELQELKKAVKEYVSRSFDDALATISDTATRIIRNIPNMANATIVLEGTKETKEGKVKDEVNAILHNDGEEDVPLKSLCGGEESTTDLAVDLAVIDFVENKANKGISIFLLDEPFTGMDTVIIEQALEVLKNANINKKLIIIDHNPEVKQMVDSRLVVVREGATSVVTQG